MATENFTLPFSYLAASVVNEGAAVCAASGADRRVHMQGTAYALPKGIAQATAASPGDPVAVQTFGPAKAWAATTITAGQPVIAASSNGALGPFIPSLATAANANRFPIGIAEQAAAAGDRFTVFVNPFASL